MATRFRLKPKRQRLVGEEILKDIRRVAAKIGTKRITLLDYLKHGAATDRWIREHYGTWTRAVFLAGLEPGRSHKVATEELFLNLAALWRKLGKQPTREDLQLSASKFRVGTYTGRFGSYSRALQEFVTWANRQRGPLEKATAKQVVVRLTPRKPNWRLRALVLMRDGATCRMCGARPEQGAKLTVDHIVPWAKGGETVLENLQILCERCNIGKHDTAPGNGTRRRGKRGLRIVSG